MPEINRRLLVTGATGKVGRVFVKRFLAEPRFDDFEIRALCHNRRIDEDRVEVVTGSIAEREVVRDAMSGVTHVVHLATVKETPDEVMDVTVKGLFWLLEEARVSPSFQRFLLLGGDAAIGHFYYPHPVPVTEQQGHTAYPGCYPLSKVLEEVMLEQYYIQYDLDGCCLRAPWIMEKDDFKHSLSFSDDQFGGPRWRELVGEESADHYVRTGAIPLMMDASGNSIKRNFVHVNDLVSAMLLALDAPSARQETFNICMDEPVDYQEVAAHMASTRGLPSVDIKTDFSSTWLDNSKAKFLLGWRPEYDTVRLVDEAWDYRRSEDDPRRIFYPG